jgi:alcohol dehydrogenase class IV
MRQDGIEMNFEFGTVGRIFFGPEQSGKLALLARQYGSKVLLLSGRSPQRIAWFKEQLLAEQIDVYDLQVPEEPTVELVTRGSLLGKVKECTAVITIGGGSVIDAGKGIAALCTNPGTIFDYLEGIGRGKPLVKMPLPHIAIPTTAGTGAEVTKNAVISSPEHRVKVSLRSQLMYPTIAIVDPLLCRTLPPKVTAFSGLDAFTQLVEAFVSNKANPLSDGFCREGISRAGRSLLKAYKDGTDIEAREDMSLASFLSGLALDNSRLGAVHGFAGPLGGMINAPHGAICAALLSHVMAANVAALKKRAPESVFLKRFVEIGSLLGNRVRVEAADSPQWIKELSSQLAVPCLSSLGLKRMQFGELVVKAKKANSMKGNPIDLTDEELFGILESAY